MGSGGVSKGRSLAIVTILVVAAIVAIGLGLGLGLRKRLSISNGSGNLESCQGQTTPPSVTMTTTSASDPLFPAKSNSTEGHYRFAAVAADAAECSEIGTRILAVDGGSTVDAAIAAILCVGIHNAHSCGIGGGHFMTYYNRRNKTVHTVIAREQAPSGASQDMYTPGKNASSQVGGMAIGIPGEIRGLHEAHQIGGRLPWKLLFRDAIRLCREGFRVGKPLADAIRGKAQDMETHPNLRETFTNPATNQPYKQGEVMTRPKLARTLEVIADEGVDAFYNGSLAANISLDIQEANGIITEDDLRGYTARVKPALTFQLHNGIVLHSPPPPSSGAVYQFIMNVLNGYNMTSDSVSSVDKAILTWHRIVEGFKHAYSLRSSLGDRDVGSDDFKAEIDELVANLTSAAFGATKRAKIDDSRTFGTAYYEPSFSNVDDHGTAHLSVLGPDGDAVSITSTVNLHFGSKVVGPRTGIIFNNEMDDFSTPGINNAYGVPPSPANFIKPWKRPLSSMCPSIATDPAGDVRLVVGASGGTRITTAVAMVSMATLWFDWGIKTAIDYPRIHHQLVPESSNIQIGFPQVLIEGLRDKGHNITMRTSASSVVQGILRTMAEEITANSDYRKHGAPDGY